MDNETVPDNYLAEREHPIRCSGGCKAPLRLEKLAVNPNTKTELKTKSEFFERVTH